MLLGLFFHDSVFSFLKICYWCWCGFISAVFVILWFFLGIFSCRGLFLNCYSFVESWFFFRLFCWFVLVWFWRFRLLVGDCLGGGGMLGYFYWMKVQVLTKRSPNPMYNSLNAVFFWCLCVFVLGSLVWWISS
jgi:hypothetical protein